MLQLIYLTESADLPRNLLTLPGVINLLQDDDVEILPMNASAQNTDTDVTAKASKIINYAQIQQSNASTYRLGQKVRTVGTSSSSSHFDQRNLDKANQIQAERRQKRNDAKTLETNIRVSITGWLHEKPKKFTQVRTFSTDYEWFIYFPCHLLKVSLLSYVRSFQAETLTSLVLDTLLEWVQAAWRKQHPSSKLLTWYFVSSFPSHVHG